MKSGLSQFLFTRSGIQVGKLLAYQHVSKVTYFPDSTTFFMPGYHDVSLVYIPKVPNSDQAPEGASGTAAVLAAVAGCLDEFSLILKGATKSSVVRGVLFG